MEAVASVRINKSCFSLMMAQLVAGNVPRSVFVPESWIGKQKKLENKTEEGWWHLCFVFWSWSWGSHGPEKV
jgi:hypothetical protein